MAQSNNSASTIFLGLATLGIGGLLVFYGRNRKGTLLGRLTIAAGTSLLLRAVRNPLFSEHLGPLAAFLEGRLATGKRLLST